MKKKMGKVFWIAALIALPAAAEGATMENGVDLTETFVAALMLVFDILLAWAARSLLPVVREWIMGRTTEGQRKLLYELTENLVAAAEQIMGRGKGSEKLQYVLQGLQKRGMTADMDLIEAAVKEMNDKALRQAQLALDITEEESFEN